MKFKAITHATSVYLKPIFISALSLSFTLLPHLYAGQKVPAKGMGSKIKNVLFIICDDLNTHVSPAGYSPIKTPALDKLASESMTFNRAHCQYPVCAGSRASLLSGLYPESTGLYLDKYTGHGPESDIGKLRPGSMSLPVFMKEKGYWTAMTGKIFHTPYHDPAAGTLDANMHFGNDELPVIIKARKQFESKNGSIHGAGNQKKWKKVLNEVLYGLHTQIPAGKGRSGLRDEQHADGKNARQVAKWLKDNAEGDKPFFIACGIQKPHVPFLAPDKYFDLYPLEDIVYTPDDPKLWDTLPQLAINERYQQFGFEFSVENDKLRREYMQAYHACITFIDAQLSLIMDALKASGHDEDTLVIFTSDHGYHLGDHFMWGKFSLFDIGTKVPFIVRAPGLTPAGSSSEAMVELIDIFPTITDLLGLDAPDQMQGLSLVKLFSNPKSLGDRKVAYTIMGRGDQLGYALRDQSWRYGKWPDGEELYDIRKDPQEKNNLANDARYKNKLSAFRVLLTQKQKEASSRRHN